MLCNEKKGIIIELWLTSWKYDIMNSNRASIWDGSSEFINAWRCYDWKISWPECSPEVKLPLSGELH